MRIRQLHWPAAIFVLILSTVSCQSDGKKPIIAKAPVAAVPAIKPGTSQTAPAKDPSAQAEDAKKALHQADAIDDVVQRAEEEYQAGQDNYQAGHPEAAKDNFDRATNILAEYPGGTASDPRLQRELERIVEGVNELETAAAKESEPSNEQKSEPAPIDEANQITFPVDPNVTAKAAAEIKATHSDLPLTLNDAVSSYINYFSTRGHGILERGLERSGMYRDMISRILKEEGVPQDLIYLAQAESGFHPLALSHAGARGLWQFIASRGASYGLQRNAWLDEREDPEKSTRAAARHLKDLYNQFGDWYLAMAAYNSGPLTVQWAVQRTGYADFWELYRRNVLPAETKNYVPIILAVTIMAKNPVQYGLDDIVPEKPLAMDRLTIDYSVDLRLVADCVGSTTQVLQDLNPSLLRMTTPKGGVFELHLPVGTAEKYQSEIAAVPREMRTSARLHRVAPGDTLASLARMYHASSTSIAEVNGLNNEELQPDATIVIPVPAGRSGDGATAFSKRATRYKVRRGDTLSSVADEFGVPVERLRRWNGLRTGARLRPGRTLIVHLPVRSGEQIAKATTSKSHHKSNIRVKGGSSSPTPVAIKSADKGRVLHTVRRGETLYSIASTYNTTVAALRRDNAKIASNLRAGDVVIIREAR